MPAVICPKCQAQNSESAKFCQKCGSALRNTSPQARAGGQTMPPRQVVTGPPPPSSRTPSKVIPGQTKPQQIKSQPPVKQPPPMAGKKEATGSGNAADPVENIAQKLDNLGEHIWRMITGSGTSGLSRAIVFEPNRSLNLEVQNGTITIQLVQAFPQNVRGNVNFNYYLVRLLNCEHNHDSKISQNGFCTGCGAPLKTLLMHEYFPQHPLMDRDDRESRIKLSKTLQGAMPIEFIHATGKSQMVFSEMPMPNAPQKTKLLGLIDNYKPGLTVAAKWVNEVGTVLERLHAMNILFYGYDYYDPKECKISDILEPLAVVNDQHVWITDISSCRLPKRNTRFEPGPDIYYLAHLFYTLITGSRPQPSPQNIESIEQVSPNLKALLRKAIFEPTIPSVQVFLQELQTNLPHSINVPENPKITKKIEPQAAAQGAADFPQDSRSLRQMAGWRTDKGRVREHNEDYVSKYSIAMDQTTNALEVGLYMVADGMGGHQSGEEASSAVTEVVIQQVHDNLNALQSGARLNRATINLDELTTPSDILRSAIQKGNDVLLNARKSIGADRGTTVTAALVIGNKAYIANVGDSRTYLLQNNKLIQQTRDHSLVDSLVRSGMIKAEEVRSHPQRNQIYRTMGDRANVEVDIFTCDLNAGDRLLLCSDGLWEMVPDVEIERIIVQSSSPQTACDRLIQQANHNGGEDNISAIVVFVE